MNPKNFYAYHIPTTQKKGIAKSWRECERLVRGKAGARYKRFGTRAEAQEWLTHGADYGFKKQLEPGIYFDAGTGRGRGVEVSVTDERGNTLLSELLSRREINRYGTHDAPRGSSNNYGELLACMYALRIALKRNAKKVFGDSRLIIEFWSRGLVNQKNVSIQTACLIAEVRKLRDVFERKGGMMRYVPGDHNPADLGFHS